MNTPRRYLANCKACDCITSGLSAGQDARRTKADPQRGGAVYTHERSGSIVPDSHAPAVASIQSAPEVSMRSLRIAEFADNHIYLASRWEECLRLHNWAMTDLEKRAA